MLNEAVISDHSTADYFIFHFVMIFKYCTFFFYMCANHCLRFAFQLKPLIKMGHATRSTLVAEWLPGAFSMEEKHAFNITGLKWTWSFYGLGLQWESS